MISSTYPEVLLPGSERAAFCLNRTEARYLCEHDIPAYFRHGIAVRPGDIVFDIGANVGLFSLSALQRCDGNLTVYAFEPIPAIVRVLRLNALRFAPGHIKVFPYGLAAARRRLDFTYFHRLPSWSSACADGADADAMRARFRHSLIAHVDAGRLMPWLNRLPPALRSAALGGMVRWLTKTRQVNCEVRTISEVMRDLKVRRIDLLKIDVEGSELDVLRGIQNPDWRKVRQVVMELEGFAANAEAVAALLKERGFAQVVLDQVDDAQRASDLGMVYASGRD